MRRKCYAHGIHVGLANKRRGVTLAGGVHGIYVVRQPPELVGRAYRFALAALRFYRKLPKSPDAQVPGVQFYRAALSGWSNYRASQRGRSRAEFIARLGTAVEESDEAVGWLEFMKDADISSDGPLLAEAREICAVLTASLRNARNNSG